MKTHYIVFLYLFISLLHVGCNSETDITVYKIAKQPPLNKTEHHKTNNLSLNWTTPNNWIQKPSTDFRIASYDIPANNNELADLSVTKFPGDAGGIEQNVNRWRRQIKLDPLNKSDILTQAKIESNMLGEYFIFKLTNLEKSILAAIIPYSKNSPTVLETIFIKMQGSTKTIETLEYEFNLFCKSLHWNH